jgi:hypothetical protein
MTHVLIVVVPVHHDFRRTSVRNLVRAGIPGRTAMAIIAPRCGLSASHFDNISIPERAKGLAFSLLEGYDRCSTSRQPESFPDSPF